VTEIELRFTPANNDLLARGLKHATVRRSRHGRPGDTFRAGGWVWKIESVDPMTLGAAADTVYPLCGLPSREAYLQAWVEQYGLSEPDLGQRVYVHRFARVLSA
jgi:hypothetical protein